MTINWKDLTNGYNRIKKAKFKTPRAMLKHLYKKEESLDKMAAILGVSRVAMTKKMVAVGINIGPKGWVRSCEKKFKGVKVAGRTAREIADEMGIFPYSVYNYARRYGFELKWVRPNRRKQNDNFQKRQIGA